MRTRRQDYRGGISSRVEKAAQSWAAAVFVLAVTAGGNVRAQYPYWADTIGSTQYDLQSTGSIGNRIALDTSAGVHFAWMKGEYYPMSRGVAYNYRSPSGEWLRGRYVSQNGTGYAQLALMPDGRAVVAYHRSRTDADSTFVAVDSVHGAGLFGIRNLPNRIGSIRHLWPHIAVDVSGRLHATATQNGPTNKPCEISYTRSEDGGSTWSAPQAVDSITMFSAIITASRVSNKVAIVYTHPPDTLLPARNDVMYIQSPDGINWDFAGGKVNITNYGGSPDSLWAWTDCDAVYDYNDILHVVWNSRPVNGDSSLLPARLLHYDTHDGVITTVATGDDHWPEAGCAFGQRNMQMCKMSMGVQRPTNDLYLAYTGFVSTDCSAGGFANGDIFMQWLSDGGSTWSYPRNLTNSQSPGCEAGFCWSDHWPSLAEQVDDYLHIVFVFDLDAGAIPYMEGQVTDNPLYYFRWPVERLQTMEDGARPKYFSHSQNYPNPFNAKTTIAFALSRESDIDLAVYDVLGRRVATVLSGRLAAGEHAVTWDAGDLSSGIYCYRLRAGGGSMTKRMTLVK
jgi:hypothetical protein